MKIIFLDIDGTLTEPGCNVPPASAIEAVRKAQEAGNLVYICTGRNYDMMKPLLEYGFDGYIASGGGYVVCGDEVIYDCPMSEDQRVRVLKVLKDAGVYRTVEGKDGSYTDEGFKEYLAERCEASGNSELLRWRIQIEKSLNIRPMAEYQDTPIYKVVIMSPDRERLKKPIEELYDEFNIIIQDSAPGDIVNGEVLSRKFDKGQAVERVCDYLGIAISDSYGFGDSMNDKEMLESVGFSVCMENGSPRMKSLAKYICPAVTEDGLHRAFEYLGLFGNAED